MLRFKKSGFTLVEIMIIITIIGILVGLIVPSFRKARDAVRTNTCKNNLRLIDAGKNQWATDNDKNIDEEPTADEVGEYITGGFPACPDDGVYTIGNVETQPSCNVHGQFF